MRTVAFLLLTCVLCAGQSLRPTTTLEAEIGNNTSAVEGSSNGNVGPGNVSKLPIRSLLYPNASTIILVRFMPWFGDRSHKQFGYRSDDGNQIRRQVEDMRSRGIDGTVVDWYGRHEQFKNHVTDTLLRESEQQGLKFAISVDSGALKDCQKSGCDVTSEMISDLRYVADHYERSPAYLRFNGRPLVTFFGLEKSSIDWNRVRSQVPGNPLLLFRNSGAFDLPFSDGAYSWLAPETVGADNPKAIKYLEHFNQVARRHADKFVMASAYKGFDDSLAGWGKGRKIEQDCGWTWLETFSVQAHDYDSGHPLPALIIPTWNDWEEGTEIESGIDNCVNLRASIHGNDLSWDTDGPKETLDHYAIFASTDGRNLTKLLQLDVKQHDIDIKRLQLPPGQYTIYVKAVAKPSLMNHMSNPVTLQIGGPS